MIQTSKVCLVWHVCLKPPKSCHYGNIIFNEAKPNYRIKQNQSQMRMAILSPHFFHFSLPLESVRTLQAYLSKKHQTTFFGFLTRKLQEFLKKKDFFYKNLKQNARKLLGKPMGFEVNEKVLYLPGEHMQEMCFMSMSEAELKLAERERDRWQLFFSLTWFMIWVMFLFNVWCLFC